MFRKRFAWIVSDEGFSVRALGRAEVRERELTDEARRDAIADNIRRALEFAGFHVDIA